MNGMMMLAVLIAAGAMIQDLKYRRISNKYLLICLAAVVCFRFVAAGRVIRLMRMWLPDAVVIEEAVRKAFGLQIPSGGNVIWMTDRDAAEGGMIPLLLLGVLFYFRMIGGADIKLLMVLGTLLGAGKSFTCVWRTVLFGAVLSAGIMAAHRSGSERFRYFGDYISRYLATGEREHYRRAGSWSSAANIHLTVPILMTVLSLCI